MPEIMQCGWCRNFVDSDNHICPKAPGPTVEQKLALAEQKLEIAERRNTYWRCVSVLAAAGETTLDQVLMAIAMDRWQVCPQSDVDELVSKVQNLALAQGSQR